MSRSRPPVTTVAVDGRRRVGLAEHGDLAGRPVFVFHGTPASRLGLEFTDAPARARHLRVICPDRPGIGCSDPDPTRTMRGYADEVLAVADAFCLDRFAVLGYSGGASYALACAAAGDGRVTATALVAGAGPIDDRPDATTGMAPSDLQLTELSLHNPAAAARQLRVQRVASRIAPWLAIRTIAAEVSPPDRAALARPIGRATVRSFVEALRQGPAGVVDDYRLYAQPWDIAWSAITGPVHIFQGDADRYVPMHHAEDILSRLPAGVGHLHPLSGVGHFSITERVGEIFDSVTPDR